MYGVLGRAEAKAFFFRLPGEGVPHVRGSSILRRVTGRRRRGVHGLVTFLGSWTQRARCGHQFFRFKNKGHHKKRDAKI